MKFLLSIFLSAWLSLFSDYPNFDDNPLLTNEMKKMIAPHLLPLDHPAKSVLDLIFSRGSVIKNERSLINAGFSIIAIQDKSSMVVARHPLAPGFVFKIYRDSDPSGRKGTPGWECLAIRCKNAKKVKKIINKNHLRHFTVPDKWLYILPTNASHQKKNHQPVILLATDMEIESRRNTKIAWKTIASREHLDELYIILSAGYGSCFLVNNIPFTKNNTFALVDLEKPKRKFNLERVETYFSEEMQNYWRSLIDKL